MFRAATQCCHSYVPERIALFIFFGGPIGGSVTVAVVCTWLIVSGVADFELSMIPGFAIYLLIGAFFGLILGIPPSLFTGVVYETFPQARVWLVVALIGALSSAVEGYFLANVFWVPEGHAPFEQRLAYATTLAVAGAIAALACHARLARNQNTEA